MTRPHLDAEAAVAARAHGVSVPGAGVDQVLELARRHLDMDVALLSEFADGHQVHRHVAGDGESFGCTVGGRAPLDDTYCQRMVRGDIPQAVPDTRNDPVLQHLAATREANIGAYVGVPIRLPDGSLYGTLCTLSHSSQDVDGRDARFLAMLAELVAREVQDDRQRHVVRVQISRLIAAEQVEVALQPVVDLASGRMLGVEALSRFAPEVGPPDVVFAVARQAGLGPELERLAIRRSLALLPLLRHDHYLAVNMSPEIAMELGDLALQHQDVPYDRLVLEITEHAVIDNYTALRDSLAWARSQGLRLAIDDAGAGYASLHHIVELAPDIIKIDRSLVDGLAQSRALRSVAAAFVALARDLDATVVAEGVERPDDLDAVRSLGIGAAQGYLLARPSVDRAELRQWLEGGLLPGRPDG